MPCVALISDIHGNLPAFLAVLAEIEARRPDAVYVLGDMVNGCPWSAEVLDILLERGWPMVLGNHEDAVIQLDTPRMEARYANHERYATLWWTHDHLSTAHLAALTTLPLDLSVAPAGLPALRLVHGVPGNFFVGFRPNGTDEWVAGRLSDVAEELVAGGHTHFPLVRRVARWLVVNDGSVGAPYDGDVRASYAWLEGTGPDQAGSVRAAPDWQAQICRVAYELPAVERGFHESGLLAAGGVTAELFRRSVLTGLPWTSDFLWWMREQPAEMLRDLWDALRLYDARHGPGNWAFPHA